MCRRRAVRARVSIGDSPLPLALALLVGACLRLLPVVALIEADDDGEDGTPGECDASIGNKLFKNKL
jgi:hypothetical protein